MAKPAAFVILLYSCFAPLSLLAATPGVSYYMTGSTYDLNGKMTELFTTWPGNRRRAVYRGW